MSGTKVSFSRGKVLNLNMRHMSPEVFALLDAACPEMPVVEVSASFCATRLGDGFMVDIASISEARDDDPAAIDACFPAQLAALCDAASHAGCGSVFFNWNTPVRADLHAFDYGSVGYERASHVDQVVALPDLRVVQGDVEGFLALAGVHRPEVGEVRLKLKAEGGDFVVKAVLPSGREVDFLFEADRGCVRCSVYLPSCMEGDPSWAQHDDPMIQLCSSPESTFIETPTLGSGWQVTTVDHGDLSLLVSSGLPATVVARARAADEGLAAVRRAEVMV